MTALFLYLSVFTTDPVASKVFAALFGLGLCGWIVLWVFIIRAYIRALSEISQKEDNER